jgi:hypothetical protein
VQAEQVDGSDTGLTRNSRKYVTYGRYVSFFFSRQQQQLLGMLHQDLNKTLRKVKGRLKLAMLLVYDRLQEHLMHGPSG